MKRYIDADEAEKLLIEGYAISDVPTADVREVKHGEIIKTGRRYPYCSLCNTSLERTYFKFCPYCGAEIDGKDEKGA
jgi:hypothetical protein